MPAPLVFSPRLLVGLQRVLVVALLLPILVVPLVAAVPALTLLPFLPHGTDSALRLLGAHRDYMSSLLTGSRSAE
ncbi:dTMP kinase [Streptomyces mirabilis]|uniref:dTMP kinase n=1 Tax=Streptomyces mirabilis TaxID=68239 RepID=UPI0036D1C297